jgi:SDR family mycofactocin-dependent oxidoreductase
VAFITGAARGQGRAHAVRLAEEGAHIVAVDALESYPTVAYPMATQEDLDETVRLVEALDRRILARQADVRSRAELQSVVDEALATFGAIDVVSANAGIGPLGRPFWELSEEQWDDCLDVNLKGVWLTCSVVAPPMIERGRGGSIIVTSSAAGLRGARHLADYNSSKHGLIGLMRTMANELARHYIRVNAICPAAVDTAMVQNDQLYQLFRPELDNPQRADVVEAFRRMNAIPEPWVDPADVSNAVLWLASDESRYVTGVALPVDLGNSIKV